MQELLQAGQVWDCGCKTAVCHWPQLQQGIYIDKDLQGAPEKKMFFSQFTTTCPLPPYRYQEIFKVLTNSYLLVFLLNDRWQQSTGDGEVAKYLKVPMKKKPQLPVLYNFTRH